MPILLITSLILVLALNRHMRHLLVTSLVLLLVLTGCGTTRDPGAGQDRWYVMRAYFWKNSDH